MELVFSTISHYLKNLRQVLSDSAHNSYYHLVRIEKNPLRSNPIYLR